MTIDDVMESLEDSEYELLNKRQQAFVDAVAELNQTGTWNSAAGSDETEFNVVDIQEKMKQLDVEPYGRTHIYRLRKDLSHIINERTQTMANEREDADGRVTTSTGKNTYEGPEKGPFEPGKKLQVFDDRPVKSTMEDDETEVEAEIDDTLLLAVDEDMLFELLRIDNKELAREIFDTVLANNENNKQNR